VEGAAQMFLLRCTRFVRLNQPTSSIFHERSGWIRNLVTKVVISVLSGLRAYLLAAHQPARRV
jgi:hypothetical protein